VTSVHDHWPDLVRSEGDGTFRVLCSCGWRGPNEGTRLWNAGVEYSPATQAIRSWGMHCARVATDTTTEQKVDWS
jgi:hypothetical protein